MSFREPAILWLILLLLVPLVLYLLPLPRRLVSASALYLWQRFLSAERFGRTSERFRRALGFALLAAILLSLILAAADLTIGSTSIKARRVVVLLDVSASMNAVVDGRSNLSRAKEAAAELIESLDSGTEVTVAETSGELRVIRPMGPGGRGAAEVARRIEPFEGPADLRKMLEKSWELWGHQVDAEVFVFTDDALPASSWGDRAHAWIAPAVGDAGNCGIVALSAQRVAGTARHHGREVNVSFTIANYGRAAAKLSGLIIVNGQTRGFFENVLVDAGKSLQRSVSFEESGEAAVQVVLKEHEDALAVDDAAYAVVPALDDLRAGVYWPEGNRRNDYVSAVMSAMQDEGVIGPVVENPPSALPVSVYVNHLPATWPEGGAIVLYPLRSGAIQIAGLHGGPITVARHAQHELLAGVDLRGLSVKGAVQAKAPDWLTPLVFGDDNAPLIWAGQTGKTKVLLVGIPVMPSGSRLPLVASFPALMRNAMQWMLTRTETLHPGERVNEWTSRRTGLVKGPDGRVHAMSVLSPAESNLRRPAGLKSDAFGRRRSMAWVCVMIAALLLPIEWGLFHKRMTE